MTEVSVKFDHFNAGRELQKILPHTGKNCGVFEIRDICKSTLDLHKFDVDFNQFANNEYSSHMS